MRIGPGAGLRPFPMADGESPRRAAPFAARGAPPPIPSPPLPPLGSAPLDLCGGARGPPPPLSPAPRRLACGRLTAPPVPAAAGAKSAEEGSAKNGLLTGNEWTDEEDERLRQAVQNTAIDGVVSSCALAPRCPSSAPRRFRSTSSSPRPPSRKPRARSATPGPPIGAG